tara:strand:- start:60 stop:1625 length:1566 start_codon:yes stop_codon:yes gene_type:complete
MQDRIIVLPDGTKKVFPAGTPDDEIAMVIEQLEAQNPAPSEEGVFSRALSNTPASIMQFGKDMVQPILHPIDTATSLYELGLGIIQLAIPEEQGNEKMARAVGRHFADRYGGIDNIKETFATDPAGFLGDASVILTAGASLPSRVGGNVGKVSNVIQKVGRAIDPATNVAKAVKGGASAVGQGLSHITGVTSGTGSVPVQQAFKAGRQGGEAADLLRSQMRGVGENTSSYERAIAGLRKIREARGAEYKKGMSEINMGARIDPLRIIEPYRATMSKYITHTKKNPNMVLGGPSFEKKLKEIDAMMRQWGLDTELHTVEQADSLKRRLDTLWEVDPVTGSLVSEVRNTVKNAIEEISPEYANVMADYQTLTDDIEHLTSELSLKNKKNPSTAVRKLQGATRNNVNTAYGTRLDMVDQLDPNLLPELSGQALNSWTPRGLAQGVAGGSIAGTSIMGGIDPLTAALTLSSQSPRIVGETALKLGQAARLGPAGGMAFDASRNIRPLEQAIMDEEERKRLGLPKN